MRHRRWIKLLDDYDFDICYHTGKDNVVTDALNQKEWAKSLRVQSLVITIHTNLPLQIHDAQVEAFKEESIKNETLR
ncbi:hypothetical protein Tco_0074543, partial [Tanacetum coccineum]